MYKIIILIPPHNDHSQLKCDNNSCSWTFTFQWIARLHILKRLIKSSISSWVLSPESWNHVFFSSSFQRINMFRFFCVVALNSTFHSNDQKRWTLIQQKKKEIFFKTIIHLFVSHPKANDKHYYYYFYCRCLKNPQRSAQPFFFLGFRMFFASFFQQDLPKYPWIFSFFFFMCDVRPVWIKMMFWLLLFAWYDDTHKFGEKKKKKKTQCSLFVVIPNWG